MWYARQRYLDQEKQNCQEEMARQMEEKGHMQIEVDGKLVFCTNESDPKSMVSKLKGGQSTIYKHFPDQVEVQ